MSSRKKAFTIVELLVVIVVIGILAAITVVSYTGIQKKARVAVLQSDLSNAAGSLEIYNVEALGYPTDLSLTNVKASSGDILQATRSDDGGYCINAYNSSDATMRMSYDSKKGLRDGLCDGITTGNSIGGVVPETPRDFNIMFDFSRWTLAGEASYDSQTGILTLGASGEAYSPLIRVDKPTYVFVGIDFYSTQSSANLNCAPDACFLNDITYYDANGDAIVNDQDYYNNGCAHGGAVNVWHSDPYSCGYYYGFSQVYYVQAKFFGSDGWQNYASPNIQLRNPTMYLYDD